MINSHSELIRPTGMLKGLSKTEIKNIYKPTLEYKQKIGKIEVVIDVWDFRSKDGKPILNNHPADLNFFFDGFDQTSEFTLLRANMINEAKKEGGVLICPRLPVIPQAADENSPNGIKIDPEIDARIILKAINDQEFNDLLKKINLKIDFNSNEIEITGFSDGNRNALQFAGLIEKLYKNKPTETHRQLNLWSTVGVVDLVDDPKDANGQVFFKAFLRELVSMATEETRIRFNREVYENKGTNFLTDHGFKIIPAGAGSKEVVNEILKIFKTKKGMEIFMRQLKDAGTKEIEFIKHLIDRVFTASSPTEFLANMAKNETRSEVCDHLESWDIRLSFPRNDMLIDPTRLGRQLRLLASKYGYSDDLPIKILSSHDDQKLGKWFLTGRIEGNYTPLISKQPAGKILFPKARSIEVHLVGNEALVLLL